MPAPISLVVPTLNAAQDLPQLLATATEGLAAGLLREVVISDGGSTDDTQAIAEAAGAVWLSGPPGRGGQLSRGCEAARGSWLLVLHADTRLPEDWSDGVASVLGNDRTAWAFRLSFRASGLAPIWVAGWANLRSRLFGLPYGDQGLLLSRHLYDAVGGYPDMPLMEDVAMSRALKGRLRLLPMTVTTGAERYEAAGWLRRGARNLWTLARYSLGVPATRLAQSYETGGSLNCKR